MKLRKILVLTLTLLMVLSLHGLSQWRKPAP